jgi:hypothetical protein
MDFPDPPGKKQKALTDCVRAGKNSVGEMLLAYTKKIPCPDALRAD